MSMPDAEAKPYRVDPLEHQGLLTLVAMKFRNLGMDDDDLLGWGQVGLLKACQTFDSSLGFQFSTYAAQSIRRTILREIHDKVPMVRLPEYLRKSLKGINPGQPVNPDNLADARAIIDRKVHGEGDLMCPLEWVAFAREEHDLAEDRENTEQARVHAHAILNGLPEREATVLRLRFGIDEERPWTLIKIGKSLGVTRERARQIEAIALARIRTKLEMSA